MKSSRDMVGSSSPEIKLTSSIYTIGYISFLGDMARGVIFPVLWKLCQELGGQTTDLGTLIATFSFGRMFFGPILGYICDRYNHKFSLMIASVLLLTGSVVWSMVYLTSNIGFLYLGQFLLGCGSGSLGVSRAYIVESCPKVKLTEVMAYMNALQFAGFTVSPILGSGLNYIGSSQNSLFLEFFLPSISIGAAAVGSLYLLKSLEAIPQDRSGEIALIPLGSRGSDELHNEHLASLEEGSSEVEKVGDPLLTDSTSSSSTPEVPSFSWSRYFEKLSFNLVLTDLTVAYLVIILVNVVARGGIAIYETLTPNMSDSMYGLSLFNLGIIVSCMGTIGTLQLIFFRYIWIPTGLNDLQLSTLGLVIMAIASFVIFDYEYELVWSLPSTSRLLLTLSLSSIRKLNPTATFPSGGSLSPSRSSMPSGTLWLKLRSESLSPLPLISSPSLIDSRCFQ
jgi:MFS family permease